MMTKKKWFVLLLLAMVAFGTKLIAANPAFIEARYSNALYPHISTILKYTFGWLPFSLGDIFYLLLAVWLLLKTIRTIRKIIKKELSLVLLKAKIYSAAIAVLLIYVGFNWLWGLNYNRQGIKQQMQISTGAYSIADLVQIDSLLVTKLNESKAAMLRQTKKNISSKEIFEGVKKAYENAGKQYPYLAYNTASIKSSLWGWAGNYMGFTGYYNPFTGEAQVNCTAPKFILPFTSCHEVAHQLGYAKENEANFVGYLAALSSTDTVFHYSAYFDLFLYAQSNLQSIDSAKASYFYRKLLPQVMDDIKELKTFYRLHQSPVAPLFRWVYGIYLRQNQQPSGLLSYDEVTGFLIAYYKKFGHI